uniref:Uncharacterized protein n=1 Tax=Burkholderia phage vB_BgluM-SURPRISE13 TaxID=3159457 RepID=A0AAU7PF27_9VIRU
MKSLEKNQANPEVNAQFATVLSMQQHLSAACLKQGLKISTTISRVDGDLPVLQYAISFNTNEPVVFTGQARSAQEPHYQTMFDLIHGRMVSEVFPPTVRSVQREPAEGSNTPIEEPVSYWKRRLVVEHDITTRDPDPKASQTDGLHMVARKSVWCGYNTKSEEIIRIEEGAANFEPEKVDRIQYMELGPRGMVVIVIFKDTIRLVQGQQGTFAEALKTAQTGFEDYAETSGSSTMASGPSVSLSSLGVSGSSSASSGGITTISSLDLSGMSLTGVAQKRGIDPSSALGQAIKRLSKGKTQPTIDIPKTMRLELLARAMSQHAEVPADTEAVVLRAASEIGIKNPTLSSRLNQRQAVVIAEKFGYKVNCLTDGGSATKTKTVVKKPAGPKAAAKRTVISKTPEKTVARHEGVSQMPKRKTSRSKKTQTND